MQALIKTADVCFFAGSTRARHSQHVRFAPIASHLRHRSEVTRLCSPGFPSRRCGSRRCVRRRRGSARSIACRSPSNGSPTMAGSYLAGETGSFAPSRHRPRTENYANRKSQSNGRADTFVRTIKRDSVRISPCADATPPSCTSYQLELQQRGLPTRATRISFTP